MGTSQSYLEQYAVRFAGGPDDKALVVHSFHVGLRAFEFDENSIASLSKLEYDSP
ncbi:hypothetical protein SBDP1_100084 [Syntrophobacter sp. SbD1]|nr:hypothetical protein SBDP1_100084 [Syntrophobacter sp. SbD1]